MQPQNAEVAAAPEVDRLEMPTGLLAVAAAVLLQRAGRAHLQRQRWPGMRPQLEECRRHRRATTVQGLARRRAAAGRAAAVSAHVRPAATRIQARWRAALARRRLAEEAAGLPQAAAKVQAAVRGRQARRRYPARPPAHLMRLLPEGYYVVADRSSPLDSAGAPPGPAARALFYPESFIPKPQLPAAARTPAINYRSRPRRRLRPSVYRDGDGNETVLEPSEQDAAAAAAGEPDGRVRGMGIESGLAGSGGLGGWCVGEAPPLRMHHLLHPDRRAAAAVSRAERTGLRRQLLSALSALERHRYVRSRTLSWELSPHASAR